MSVAMSSIIDGYVFLKDRQALEDMREHRLRLREQLLRKRTGAFDPGKSVQLYETEVAMIETGLGKLNGSAVV
jgi:hypothetical protein